MMREIAILLAVAAASFAQTTPDAQPGLTLRTTTTLVQVNVIAHDAKGRAVTDLKREDFEILDNGEKQKIATFAAETAETAAAPLKAAAPTAFPEDKPAPPEHDHGYAVVLIDYMNSGKMSAGWAKTQVQRLLKDFDPASKAALYMFDDDGVTTLGDFGTDREAMFAKMAKLYGSPNGCPDGYIYSEFDPMITDTRCEEGVYFFLYQRDLKTVDMLERFADRLSFMPGRKALIWITTASDARDPTNAVGHVPEPAVADYTITHLGGPTGKFQVSPLGSLPQMEARIEHAIRKLNNADVGLYMVNPCAFIKLDVCYARTNVMQDFAKRTGGQAILDPYDAPAALRAAIEDVRTTYSLAFYAPPDADLNKFHQLNVQVNRPGVKLSYRQGYSLGTDLNAASLVKEIPGAEARALRAKALAMAPSVFKELEGLAAIPAAGSFGAALAAPYFYTGANVAVVDLALELGVEHLKFQEADGKQRAELNFAAQAVRPDGAVAAKFTDTLKLSFATEAEAAAFLKRPYRYEHQFRLAPGKYDVRVAFGSGETSLGRANAPVEIGGWDGKTLAVSGVALARETRKADAGAAALEARKALVSRGMETIPTGNVRFKSGEPCKAYFEVYDPLRGAANAPSLSAQVRVLDESGAQKVDSGAFAVDNLAKPGERTIPVSLSVPVNDLAPGKYRLEIKAVRAGGETVTRLADFEVKE